MNTIHYKQTPARIVTCGGLPLIGKLLLNANFYKECDDLPVAKAHPEVQIRYSEVLAAAIATLCIGNSTFEGIHSYDGDKEFYADAIGIERFPSAETFRQRLDQIGKAAEQGQEYHSDLRDMNTCLLLKNGVSFRVYKGMVFLDIDVTPHDQSNSHKEGVEMTYKKVMGYAPINAYLDNFFVNTEFRIGSQHSQCGTEQFLVETIDICNRLIGDNARLLIRLDSGNDAVSNMGIILERGHYFIIKRNLRRESKEQWLDLAEAYAPAHETPREGKDIYVGSTWKEITYKDDDGLKHTRTIRIVYEVIKRTIDKNGQYLLIPDIEVNTFWDNTGYPDAEVIRLYHQHGEMEQFHSELKSDMDLEKLPSGKFATNTLIYDLSMIAYNLLRMLSNWTAAMRKTPMRGTVLRRRLRTIIQHIIYAPARVTMHGGSMSIDLGSSNIWAPVVVALCDKICSAA